MLVLAVVIVCGADTAGAQPDPPVVAIESLQSPSGDWDVVAQDASGAFWHLQRAGELEETIVPLGSQGRGAFALVRSGAGPMRLLAAGTDGAVWSRASAPGGWTEWASLGGTGARDVTAVARGDELVLVARDAAGGVSTALLQKDGRTSEWRRVADGATERLQAVVVQGRQAWIFYLQGHGRLMAAAEERAPRFRSPVAIAERVVGRPVVVAEGPGAPALLAATSDGTLIRSRLGNSGWTAAEAVGRVPADTIDLDAHGLADGQVLLSARRRNGVSFAARPPGGAPGEWASVAFRPGDEAYTIAALDSGFVQFLASAYVRDRRNEMLAPVPPKRPLKITAVSPENPWDADDVTVDYTFENFWKAPAGGTLRARFAGSDGEPLGGAVVPLEPRPGSCPGGEAQPCQGRFRFTRVPAGTAEIVVSYAQGGRRGGPSGGSAPTIDDISKWQRALDRTSVDVRSFRSTFATDAAPVTPGPWQCQAVSPDDTLLPCGKTLCDPSGALPEFACPPGCPRPNSPSAPYNHQLECAGPTAGQVGSSVAPTSTADVVNAVKQATGAGARVRVVGAQHSANAQLCSGNWVISTQNLKGSGSGGPIPQCAWPVGPRPLAELETPCLEQIDGQTVVQAAAGQDLYALAERLYASGLSLGYAIPGFRHATVAGAIATGTHGSSPAHPAVISSRVDSITLVRPDGDVEEATARQTLRVKTDGSASAQEAATDRDVFRALRTHLGYMGVVVRVGLRVEPAFNLRTSWSWHAWKREEDVDPFGLVQGCDYATLTWFPGTHEVLRLCGVRTEVGDPQAPVDPGAENALFRAPEGVDIPVLGGVTPRDMARWQIDAACGTFTVGTCFLEDVHAALLRHSFPPMTTVDCGTTGWLDVVARLTDSPLYTGDSCSGSKVGPAHLMVSSALPGVRDARGAILPVQRDWEMFLPRANAVAALKAGYRTFETQGTCLPLLGVFLRFAPTEDATLVAHTAATATAPAGETGVFFEMPVALPRNMRCSDQARYEQPYASLAETLVTTYGARPHWGKNRASLLQLQRTQDSYGENMRLFRHAVSQYDPRGTFASGFGVDIGLRWPELATVPQEEITQACLPD